MDESETAFRLAFDDLPQPSSRQCRFYYGTIWAFQPHLEKSIQITAKDVFVRIGFRSSVHVYFIGYRQGVESGFDILIGEGVKPTVAVASQNLEEEVEARLNAHPDRSMFHTDPRLDRQSRVAREMMTRAAVIGDFVFAQDRGLARFDIYPATIGNVQIFGYILVETDALERVPSLGVSTKDHVSLLPSLVHAVCSVISSRVTSTLYRPDPGSGFDSLDISTDEIARRAGNLLFSSAQWLANSIGGSIDYLTSISALPYEGREGQGRIVVAREGVPGIVCHVRLEDAVSLSNTRAARKLLEACGPSLDLLSNGNEIWGIGSARATLLEEEAYVVDFHGRDIWSIDYKGHQLMAVVGGIPTLPLDLIDVDLLADLVDRLVPQAQLEDLVSLMEEFRSSAHGSMLVISSAATDEAKRLSTQAWAVRPKPLETRLITSLTSMDGAVLVDGAGNCSAIGVILDGVEAGHGDPARGSRFNSAIRYIDSDAPPCIILVCSEDGGVDLLPALRPRVYRSDVDAAVSSYVSAVNLNEKNIAWRSVKRLEFYLSADQCANLNQLRKIHEEELMKAADWSPVESVEPNPDLDDSYFWE